MDLLNPDLQWLLTEMLPDGPLAILTNESSIFNRFCYFDDSLSIQHYLQLELPHFYQYKYILLLHGPNIVKRIPKLTIYNVLLNNYINDARLLYTNSRTWRSTDVYR